MNLGDLSAALWNVNSISSFLVPSAKVEELDTPLRGYSCFSHLMVNWNLLYAARERSKSVKFLSHTLWLNTYKNALSSLEANKQGVCIKPLKARQLAIRFVKLDEFMSLVLGVKVEDLWVRNDTAHELFLFSLLRAPSNVGRFSLDDKAVKRSVSLVIRYSKHLVGRARHQVAINTPFTICDFFAVLWNARNFPLTLSVEESKRTFLCANDQYWVRFWPADIRGRVLVACKFNILELSLAHWPDWDNMRLSQNCKRITIFIPCKPVNSWLLIAWKLKHRFALSINLN